MDDAGNDSGIEDNLADPPEREQFLEEIRDNILGADGEWEQPAQPRAVAVQNNNNNNNNNNDDVIAPNIVSCEIFVLFSIIEHNFVRFLLW